MGALCQLFPSRYFEIFVSGTDIIFRFFPTAAALVRSDYNVYSPDKCTTLSDFECNCVSNFTVALIFLAR